MISSILLAVPTTPSWSPTVAIIMSLCTLIAVVLAPKMIAYPEVGPKFPGLPLPLSLPAFVAATCLGQAIGVGVVLGLTYIGRL